MPGFGVKSNVSFQFSNVRFSQFLSTVRDKAEFAIFLDEGGHHHKCLELSREAGQDWLRIKSPLQGYSIWGSVVIVEGT